MSLKDYLEFKVSQRFMGAKIDSKILDRIKIRILRAYKVYYGRSTMVERDGQGLIHPAYFEPHFMVNGNSIEVLV